MSQSHVRTQSAPCAMYRSTYANCAKPKPQPASPRSYTRAWHCMGSGAFSAASFRSSCCTLLLADESRSTITRVCICTCRSYDMFVSISSVKAGSPGLVPSKQASDSCRRRHLRRHGAHIEGTYILLDWRAEVVLVLAPARSSSLSWSASALHTGLRRLTVSIAMSQLVYLHRSMYIQSVFMHQWTTSGPRRAELLAIGDQRSSSCRGHTYIAFRFDLHQ